MKRAARYARLAVFFVLLFSSHLIIGGNRRMIKEFKEFIARGNVIDMSVGVVVGGAFTAIVNAIVSGFITPLVGLVIKLLTGSKNAKFTGLNIDVLGVQLNFGNIVSAVITFFITAAVVFLLVKAINAIRLKSTETEEKEELTLTEETLQDIQAT